MRIRSLMAASVASVVCLGFTVGCGSSSNNSEYVVSSAQVQQQTTGSVVFNLVKAQTAFSVDTATATLKFEFFDGVTSNAVYTATKTFATSITLDGVPTSARTVVITSFDANGFPLSTITQAIEVVGGATTPISAVNTKVPVLLNKLRVVSSDLSKIDTALTSISVPVGGTFQTFLAAEYSNGSVVLVGSNATYAIGNGGGGFASVNNLGTISGLAAGTTTLDVGFAGQTLSIPLTVSNGVTVNFTSLKIENTQPIQLAPGGTATLAVVADNQFGLNPADSRLTYVSNSNGFTVTNGVLKADAGLTAGATATITATYTNPDTTKVTATVTVEVVAAGP